MTTIHVVPSVHVCRYVALHIDALLMPPCWGLHLVGVGDGGSVSVSMAIEDTIAALMRMGVRFKYLMAVTP